MRKDIAPPVKQTRRKPGELPPGRLAVIDANGNRRGHVGAKASQATCARFGVFGAELRKGPDGKLAWVGTK
jgi:hypothetical protein